MIRHLIYPRCSVQESSGLPPLGKGRRSAAARGWERFDGLRHIDRNEIASGTGTCTWLKEILQSIGPPRPAGPGLPDSLAAPCGMSFDWKLANVRSPETLHGLGTVRKSMRICIRASCARRPDAAPNAIVPDWQSWLSWLTCLALSGAMHQILSRIARF